MCEKKGKKNHVTPKKSRKTGKPNREPKLGVPQKPISMLRTRRRPLVLAALGVLLVCTAEGAALRLPRLPWRRKQPTDRPAPTLPTTPAEAPAADKPPALATPATLLLQQQLAEAEAERLTLEAKALKLELELRKLRRDGVDALPPAETVPQSTPLPEAPAAAAAVAAAAGAGSASPLPAAEAAAAPAAPSSLQERNETSASMSISATAPSTAPSTASTTASSPDPPVDEAQKEGTSASGGLGWFNLGDSSNNDSTNSDDESDPSSDARAMAIFSELGFLPDALPPSERLTADEIKILTETVFGIDSFTAREPEALPIGTLFPGTSYIHFRQVSLPKCHSQVPNPECHTPNVPLHCPHKPPAAPSRFHSSRQRAQVGERDQRHCPAAPRRVVAFDPPEALFDRRSRHPSV